MKWFKSKLAALLKVFIQWLLAIENTQKLFFAIFGIGLIVSLAFNPSTGVASEQELSGFVVTEDEDWEGDGRQPPVDLQRVHPQALVHPWCVGEDGGKKGLEDEAKIHEVVLHALLEHGVLPGLADDQVRPLDNHDGHKEGCMASVFQDLSVPVRLWGRGIVRLATTTEQLR